VTEGPVVLGEIGAAVVAALEVRAVVRVVVDEVATSAPPAAAPDEVSVVDETDADVPG
jgi:hypothetical protein